MNKRNEIVTAAALMIVKNVRAKDVPFAMTGEISTETWRRIFARFGMQLSAGETEQLLRDLQNEYGIEPGRCLLEVPSTGTEEIRQLLDKNPAVLLVSDVSGSVLKRPYVPKVLGKTGTKPTVKKIRIVRKG